MRILLIVGNPTTSKTIELTLRNANMQVYATDLGEEGIELAKLYEYDLILLDLNLPDMHGHDVLRELRRAKIKTPILILTTYGSEELKLQSFQFGANSHMTMAQPFNRKELIEHIRRIVRHSKGSAAEDTH